MSTETTMRCEDVAPYLSAFADGELLEPLRSEVAEHVATCDACSATLVRYGEIDSLLAGMPRTAPPPEALDDILAVVAAEGEQTERRHAVRSAWGLTSFKRKIVELDMPLGDKPPVQFRPTTRSRWVSIAIPAIAAMLLVSVALVTFRWLPNNSQIILPVQQPTATPAPGNQTLTRTSAAVEAIRKQLAFKPVLPTYLPDGATLSAVAPGPPRDSEISEHYLDISWNVNGPGGVVNTIHLHEAPSKLGLVGYSLPSVTPQVEWQIGNAPWQQVRVDATPKNTAVAQFRAGVSIALDVSTPSIGPQAAAGNTILRLMSLSMDSRYVVMPTAPDESSARIVSVPYKEMVAHYKVVALNGNGAVAWREDAYVAPCASTADPCQVSEQYSLGANGPVLYTDISSGQRLLHLDQAQQTYTLQPIIPGDQSATLNGTALPGLFYLGNTYLNSGILWYLNETTFNKQRVYDLLWTNAPTRTHVYVSTSTHQVVAMQVEKNAKIQDGGPLAGSGALSCTRYTMIEYLTPDAATDAQFAQSIPPTYTQSQEQQPVSLTC
ncbi:MAG TPA: zf-HC2 domain-containing protein [Ktedonobacterales bacterium]|nr:zf-HC2 domain-containing protein [Ktedonobacterales bacterium]